MVLVVIRVKVEKVAVVLVVGGVKAVEVAVVDSAGR